MGDSEALRAIAQAFASAPASHGPVRWVGKDWLRPFGTFIAVPLVLAAFAAAGATLTLLLRLRRQPRFCT